MEINETRITTSDYKDIKNSLPIDQIELITIATKDYGPLGTDLWWFLVSDNKTLSIPNGATGETEMTKYLQEFSGFSNEQLSKAMSSIDNREFILWKKA